jgi:radical SAM superfamily enzyme with C-terminal helix-hairpin-helix motif
MLEKIYPAGTVLREIRIEEVRDGYSYGRQIASYAITARIPLELKQKVFYDVMVSGHRERSVIALPLPIAPNTLPRSALKTIPGVGVKGAENLILNRPFGGSEDFRKMFPSVSAEIISRMVF